MLENLMINKWIAANRATAITSLGGYGHITGTMWIYNGEYYQYGGKTATYTDDNSFRKLTPPLPSTNYQVLTTTSTDGQTYTVQCPNSIVIGNLVYIVGKRDIGSYAVIIFNTATLQRTSYYYTGGPAHAGDPDTGVVFDGVDTIYAKSPNQNNLIAFNINTKAFRTVVSNFTGNQLASGPLAYRNGYIYMMGGYNTAYVTQVTRIKASDGTYNINWDTLKAQYTNSWQGVRSVKGVFRYCTWADGATGAISYCVYDPEAKNQVTRRFNTGLSHRNGCFQQIIPGGVIYGGGTSIPVGSPNWQTQGRTNQLYLISDPDITTFY